MATGEAMPATNKLTSFHCGGSTIPVEIVESFHDRFGIWLRESWGMSELYGIITGHPDDGQPVPAGSVGHVLPFYRVKIVELDESNRFVRELPTGERGVLVVQGPAVVPGYAERALDRDLFVTGLPGTWASTGDLGMPRRRRPPVALRARQGPHHPRRPQHRPARHRGGARPASGGAALGRHRQARREQGRAAHGVRAAQTGARRLGR